MAASLVYALGIVLVAVSGCGQAVQAGMNSKLGSHTGKAFAGMVSFSMGLLSMAMYFLVDVYGAGSKPPTLASMRGAPHWSWVGGTFGAFYVCCTIVFAAQLGAGTLTAISMCAQLIAAIVLDNWGLVGFPKRKVHWARVLGAFLLLGGVVLMTVFRGDVLEQGTVVHGVQGDVSVKGGVANSSTNSNGTKSIDHHVVEMSAASGAGSLPIEHP